MKEATYYEDMGTVDGEECASLIEACRRRGLLINNMRWNNLLSEELRSNVVPFTELFATSIVHCLPSHPRNSYIKNLNIIPQNYCHRRGRSYYVLPLMDGNGDLYGRLELEEYF